MKTPALDTTNTPNKTTKRTPWVTLIGEYCKTDKSETETQKICVKSRGQTNMYPNQIEPVLEQLKNTPYLQQFVNWLTKHFGPPTDTVDWLITNKLVISGPHELENGAMNLLTLKPGKGQWQYLEHAGDKLILISTTQQLDQIKPQHTKLLFTEEAWQALTLCLDGNEKTLGAASGRTAQELGLSPQSMRADIAMSLLGVLRSNIGYLDWANNN